MKVLLIHQVFVSPGDAGGTRHFEFARHFLRQGHELSIVASDLSYLTGKKMTAASALVTPETIHGIHVLRSYTYASLHKSFVWRVISFLSFMCTSLLAGLRAGPVDLVMGTSPPIFQACSAWLLSVLRRKPFLLEIRDLWPAFAIDMGVLKSRPLIRLSRWLESFLYAHADHILVNSPAYRDYIVGKGIAEDKISFISNGVDPGMFDPEMRGEAVRRELNLNGHFVATYAGALGMANDIPTILRAAQEIQHHPQIKFLIVGDGKESGNAQKLARSLQLTNVIFAGARPKSEMPGLLAASDACIATLQDIPMFRMTYPNKVFDYMAAGRPTILGIDGVIRKVLDEADGGIFVAPGNSSSLANAVLFLYQNPQRAAQMGLSARRHVAQHFNRLDQAEQFLSLALKLARNP